MEEPAHEADRHGKLNATIAKQAIHYPTDLSLLNNVRQFRNQIINLLYAKSGWKHKPRTYRHRAHQSFLELAKRRLAGRTVRRGAIKEQWQYLCRNLGHIQRLMDT